MHFSKTLFGVSVSAFAMSEVQVFSPSPSDRSFYCRSSSHLYQLKPLALMISLRISWNYSILLPDAPLSRSEIYLFLVPPKVAINAPSHQAHYSSALFFF